MFTLILADAELELMPPELRHHPRVVSRAKKRRRAPEHLLLDQAHDHEAMRGLAEGDRRGRPDIAHVVTLLWQDSIVNAKGQARLLVHTRDDVLLRVRPDTRIMRNQAKFVTLIEDLLRQGQVPLDRPLLVAERGRTLASILAEVGGVKVLLDESGELARGPDFTALARENGDTDVTVVLGGFPRGSYRSAAKTDMTLRVADEPVSAWSALVPVLAGLEDACL